MNPHGKVPTIQFNDGRIVYESDIIINLIDEIYSTGTKLYPEDKIEKAILQI